MTTFQENTDNSRFKWLNTGEEELNNTNFYIEGEPVTKPFIEHNTAIVHYERGRGLAYEELYRNKARLINALRLGGFNVAGINFDQLSPDSNVKQLGASMYQWPRDCFLAVPRLHDNQDETVFTIPLGKVRGKDPYEEIIDLTTVPFPNVDCIQTPLSIGGFSV
ncbi:hypothetical protein KA012_02085 [Candidatus Woesebacteria bacterium]|nr:hypothetical protein [Candidatus Woesebacteria bacterium]